MAGLMQRLDRLRATGRLQAQRPEALGHDVIALDAGDLGAGDDPQRLATQEARLREAGAETYVSNAEAATRCLVLLNRA